MTEARAPLLWPCGRQGAILNAGLGGMLMVGRVHGSLSPGKRKVLRLGAMLFCLASLALAVPFPSQAADAAPMRLCWESTEKPPYLVIPRSLVPTGISVDLVAAILNKAGLSARAVVRPWKRCLSDLSHGALDLVPNASYNVERTEYALYSKPIYRTRMAFFYDPNRYPAPPQLRRLEDLHAYRIGGVLGFNYAYLRDVPIDTGTRDREALLRKLEAGRIDLAVEQLEVMREMIDKGGFHRNQFAYVIDPFLPEKAFHILISKQHPQAQAMRERIDAAIDALERDGTLERIRTRTSR